MYAIATNRIWRSALLVAAGVAIGATLVAPVSARAPSRGGGTGTAAATYTRSASCAGLSFYPATNVNNVGYSNDGSLRFNLGSISEGGPEGTYRCDPGLPTGAVVTRVQFTLKDTDALVAHQGPPYQVTGCSLVRSGLTVAGAPTYQFLAAVPGTGAAPGVVRLQTRSISHATIDNSRFVYWLECQIFEIGPKAGIYGADVIYTISANKG